MPLEIIIDISSDILSLVKMTHRISLTVLELQIADGMYKNWTAEKCLLIWAMWSNRKLQTGITLRLQLAVVKPKKVDYLI